MSDPDAVEVLLGEDGRLHDGSYEERFSGAVMFTACGAAATRPISNRELRVWDKDLMCPECFQEEPEERRKPEPNWTDE